MNVWFVEILTIRTWCLSVWPRAAVARLRGRAGAVRAYAIEWTPVALRLAAWMGRLIGVTVEPLEFRLADVRDEAGLSIRLRVNVDDIARIQADVVNDPLFREAIKARGDNVDRKGAVGRFPTYLAKGITTMCFTERGTLFRAMLTIQVCAWVMRTRHAGQGAVLFLEDQPWMQAMTRYATRDHVRVIPMSQGLGPRGWLRRSIAPELLVFLRELRRWRGSRRVRGGGSNGAVPASVRPPRIAVEYYGQLNLNQPDCFSDLFFWQQSALPGRDILMTFQWANDPLDAKKWDELCEHGIAAVALDPKATTLPGAPVFTPRPRFLAQQGGRARSTPRSQGRDARWVRERAADYQASRAYWGELFDTYGIKIYVTWFKYDELHCAIADALEGLGGVTAIYQRAYESEPFPELTIATDIVFGFSQAVADVERRMQSIIRYHVTTGYLGDHRFPLWREQASSVRRSLQHHGARRVLAYTDESSKADPRWNVASHEFMRANYAFLLERVLAEPWLGLVIKPKHPVDLRRRLGPVAPLLKHAEATGRCVVYEGGNIHGPCPPVAAALASDVMIHGHLCAATAGVESALAGVPTLLLDREGWSVSPLYRLGVGRVVFLEWPALWSACVEHWERPGGVPGFGDWSLMRDEIDPFQDGRAGERMGTYLQWLLEGFKAGLDRETVMADAAQRYASIWGSDKVTSVNVGADRRAWCLPARDGVRGTTGSVLGVPQGIN